MTLYDLLNEGNAALQQAGDTDGENDAKLLLFEALHLDLVHFLMDRLRPLSEQDAKVQEQIRTYRGMIAKRASRIPLQQILGSQEFMGLDFFVNEHVLIPRQDTETLVTEAARVIQETPREKLSFFEKLKGGKEWEVLDLCCGSGAVGISLAKISSNVKVLGTDVSEKALAVAEENAKNLRVKMRFARGDMFAPAAGKKFDMIVSNPPYIRTRMISILQEEVKDHEPLQALDGGRDGLDFYRVIVKEAADHLKPGGFLLLEIGHDQGEDLRKMIRDDGRYTPAEIIRDLPGKDRVVKCEIRDKNEHRAEAKGVTEEQGEDQ